MSQVDLLYRLQQIEDENKADKKRLAEVIRLQSESIELIKARKAVETAETEVSRLRAIQKEMNLELDDLCDKAKREENRLYSGLVTNPKELADLQREIDSLRKRISTFEDGLLEIMLEVEEAESSRDEAVGTLNTVQEDWQETSSRCKDEQVVLLKRISEQAEQKKQLITMIQPAAMAAFETAKRRAGEVAVVAMKNGRCRGCLVGVSSMKQKYADEGQMVTCDNCGRILCPI
ncbi:MAG: zinc ribbon domain-containing protein [Candidatus Promineifilaceae bacterium]|jgi:predicted  nucleic acid-binding Zn-ribbon protein